MRLGFFLAVWLWAVSSWAAGPVEEVSRAFDLAALTRPDSARIVRFSSSDRSGGNHDGLQDPGAREANLRREGDGWVLAEVTGPGRLVRLWMTQLEQVERVRFYFDGESAPRIDLTPEQLFSGKTFPFLTPLSGDEKHSSGGFYSYVPLPFGRGLKITAVGQVHFFQIDLRMEAPATPVASYEPVAWERERVPFEAWLQVLQLNRDQEPAGLRRSVVRLLPAGGRRTILELAGSGMIHALSFQLGPPIEVASRDLWLRIYWDGGSEPCLETPLAELVPIGRPPRTIQGFTFRSGAGQFDLLWKMPFSAGARIVLENRSLYRQAVALTAWVEKLPPQAVPPLRFHAGWNGSGEPGSADFELVEIEGEGRLVGVQLSLAGAAGLEYLESDETILVDGESDLSLQGTGIEDFFNGGFYFSGGLFTQLFHGCPLKIGERVSAYRHLISDAVPFRRSLSVRFEAPPGQARAVWSGVALWYQSEPHAPARFEPALAAAKLWPDLAESGQLDAAELYYEQTVRSWVVPTDDRRLNLSARGRRGASFYFTLSRPLFGRVWLIYMERPWRPAFKVVLEGAAMAQVEAAPPDSQPRLVRLDLGCLDLNPGVRRFHLWLEPGAMPGNAQTVLELSGIQVEADSATK
jgi:hypothetical protein